MLHCAKVQKRQPIFFSEKLRLWAKIWAIDQLSTITKTFQIDKKGQIWDIFEVFNTQNFQALARVLFALDKARKLCESYFLIQNYQIKVKPLQKNDLKKISGHPNDDHSLLDTVC